MPKHCAESQRGARGGREELERDSVDKLLSDSRGFTPFFRLHFCLFSYYQVLEGGYCASSSCVGISGGWQGGAGSDFDVETQGGTFRNGIWVCPVQLLTHFPMAGEFKGVDWEFPFLPEKDCSYGG